MEKKLRSHVQILGREELTLEVLTGDAGKIHSISFKAIGGPEFLSVIEGYREQNFVSLSELTAPEGIGPGELLLRQAILEIKGQWDFPCKEEFLCRCRGIKTTVVDAAILSGAHDPKIVSQLTSASTACGTCQPEVEALIEYRKKAA